MDTARVEFTKEMKKTYTILFPNMCDIHFRILLNVFKMYGYKIEMLTGTDSSVIEDGLKYVHNDTCYPALITIGQMINALKSGKYDLNKTALMMSQTGGGCRASNYIHLLRKALKNAGMPQVPVISVNPAGMEKNSGFKITLPLLRHALAAVAYGDLLMLLSNQTKPYEVNKGETAALTEKWVKIISEKFAVKSGVSLSALKAIFPRIVSDFEKIPTKKVNKTKVGIVGEIYVKYSALANNNLEKFLEQQGCEVMIPGLLGFFLYTIDARVGNVRMYGGSAIKMKTTQWIFDFIEKYENYLIDAVKASGKFVVPASFSHLKSLINGIIGSGCVMGEGWLLTAEMMELIENGYENIVCAQPFGCLPNHIVGKGMIRKIRTIYPQANIVPVDYDPGATKVNQENRIKLMLAVARESEAAAAKKNTANV